MALALGNYAAFDNNLLALASLRFFRLWERPTWLHRAMRAPSSKTLPQSRAEMNHELLR